MVDIPSKPQVAMLLGGIKGHLHRLSNLSKVEVMITMDSRARQVQLRTLETMVMGSHRLEDMDK